MYNEENTFSMDLIPFPTPINDIYGTDEIIFTKPIKIHTVLFERYALDYINCENITSRLIVDIIRSHIRNLCLLTTEDPNMIIKDILFDAIDRTVRILV